VKDHGSTVETLSKLRSLRLGEEIGIPGVAVKCVDIRRNTRGEGESLDRF
jgi:hypothetical protein